MKLPTLDIVIVNWRSDDLLRRCLASLRGALQPTFTLGKVVIVENECGLASPAWRSDFPELPVRVLRNQKNLGFARACNQGAAASGSEYILFLNPDMELNSHSLDVPVEFLAQSGPEVGICGIRLLDGEGKPSSSCWRFPTLARLLKEAVGIDKVAGGVCAGRRLDPARLTRSGWVDQVIGAFFMVKRSVYDAIDGFDERFFVYFEEVDFALRCSAQGYGSYYLAEATACHHGGGSSGQVLDVRLFYSLRSRLQYARKHFAWFEMLTLILAMATFEPVCRVTWALVSRQRQAIGDTIRAYAKLWHFFLMARR